MLQELLLRTQFVLTICYYFLWQMFTVGLSLFLFICEVLFLKTKNREYILIYTFWVKFFAISFGISVLISIITSLNIGIYFKQFAESTTPFIKSLLSFESFQIFLLEIVCVCIMLFGRKKVGNVIHFIATIFVMFGTYDYVLPLLILNWLTNTDMTISSYRVTHMICISYIISLLMVIMVCVSYIIKNRSDSIALKSFNIALIMLMFLLPFQIISGYLYTSNTYGVLFWVFRGILTIECFIITLIIMSWYYKRCNITLFSIKYLKFIWCIALSGFIMITLWWVLDIIDKHPSVIESSIKNIVIFTLPCLILLYSVLIYCYINFFKLVYKKGNIPIDALE